MGCSTGDTECLDHEKPAHPVKITRAFFLNPTEVTTGQYRRYSEASGAEMPQKMDWTTEETPVVKVSWNDAAAFCRWAGGRLPSEAEWEYAARGGSPKPWHGIAGDVSWNYENSGQRGHPVGGKAPNGFGLYDMLGNASEWCSDWYGERYSGERSEIDPTGPPSGRDRVHRGGAYFSSSWWVRASARDMYLPAGRLKGLGFRCVRETPPAAPGP